MKHALIRRIITLLVISLATSPILSIRASAGEGPALAAAASGQSGSQNFGDAELDELLGPIALYPDPLLAQVLPAATFVDQIDEAERLLNGRTDNELIDGQNWDVSVKSIAHYPAVLSMMNQKRDWAITLGQAYVNQSTDVVKSVQRLRAEARAAGSLITTPQQQVIVDGQAIRIVPAQPQVIYVLKSCMWNKNRAYRRAPPWLQPRSRLAPGWQSAPGSTAIGTGTAAESTITAGAVAGGSASIEAM
jgi:hypothetical protein